MMVGRLRLVIPALAFANLYNSQRIPLLRRDSADAFLFVLAVLVTTGLITMVALSYLRAVVPCLNDCSSEDRAFEFLEQGQQKISERLHGYRSSFL